MAIRLDNFEQAVESTIVQRGRTYFRSGSVIKCTDEDGEVNAVVQGSKQYKVSMVVDDDGVVHEHRCSCPYDWGEFCKHEVAVLYYLRKSRKSNAKRSTYLRNAPQIKNETIGNPQTLIACTISFIASNLPYKIIPVVHKSRRASSISSLTAIPKFSI